jgi:hypothetical protein
VAWSFHYLDASRWMPVAIASIPWLSLLTMLCMPVVTVRKRMGDHPSGDKLIPH